MLEKLKDISRTLEDVLGKGVLNVDQYSDPKLDDEKRESTNENSEPSQDEIRELLSQENEAIKTYEDLAMKSSDERLF